jgi:predicted glycosyltransferase
MTRVLFSVPGKRGLGHVVRGLNIARAVRRLDPAVDCVFASRGPAAREVVGDEFPVVVGPADDVWAAADGRPDVVVFDTALPAALPPLPAVPVYVMRRSRDEHQAEVFAHPLLAAMAVVVVPHTEEEFGHRVPEELRERCRFVGPISRLPTPAGTAAARARYAGDASVLLTSTVGGGGFTDQAAVFFATVAAVHRHLPEGVAHVVVTGPNYTGPVPELPGATVVRFDPALVELLAASDLVVAEGGYNTVTEVRLARTPAVFLPSARNWDDQEERVRALERRGLARVATGPHRVAAVLDAVGSPQWWARVRDAYATDVVRTGNEAAARAILEVAPSGDVAP